MGIIKESWETIKDMFNCVIIKPIKSIKEYIKRKNRLKREAKEMLLEHYWYNLSPTEKELIQELFKLGSVTKDLAWWCNECKEEHTVIFQHWLDNGIITREEKRIPTDNFLILNYNYIYTLTNFDKS